jgi:hypothetical protein
MLIGSLISRLAWATAPFLLGLSIGFFAALLGLARWVTYSSTVSGRNLVATLKRVGLQYAAAGALLTVAAASCLSRFLPDLSCVHAVQGALWGFPVGLCAGIHWICRRGAR